MQGNILRLFKATGMDSTNMFPYVRAALIGHATRKHTGQTSCSQMYTKCPSDPDRMVDYFNNHNGGIVHQVYKINEIYISQD
jgi:hypothetical protein